MPDFHIRVKGYGGVFKMDIGNLKKGLWAIKDLALGFAIVGIAGTLAYILVNVLADKVSDGTIPVSSAANTSIQAFATTMNSAIDTVGSNATLVGGLAAVAIIILVLVGKFNLGIQGGDSM